MSTATPLPTLSLSDFGPGMDHIAEAHQGGRIFAILHVSDTARPLLPQLALAPGDPWTYVFVHGARDVARFENLEWGTHEVPDHVVATLLASHYGSLLTGRQVRLCTCYGNMLRPGETRTAAHALAGLLPQVRFEAYHGLVTINAALVPPQIELGNSLAWSPLTGAYVIGAPGNWEPVQLDHSTRRCGMSLPTVRLKPVVRFREFPFGTVDDPSMREAMSPEPWEDEANVLDYLRSGLILALPMGADLADPFDPPSRANVIIDGERVGGVRSYTDGVWVWYAGLIHFIEKYHVRVCPAFVAHARAHGWRVDRDAVPRVRYDFSYFTDSAAVTSR